MLRVSGLETGYGHSQVLFGVELTLNEGEMVTLLGRNGMGKTTTVRAIMGLTPPRAGSVRFDGRELGRLPSHTIARCGLGLVPEGRQIFPNLAVQENLLVTAANRRGSQAPWHLDRASTPCFHAWPSGPPTGAISSPAGNSRCWPSAGR